MQNPKNGVPVFLFLVGGGNEKYESEMKNLAQKLDISEKVIFAGLQSDVRSFYWLSDLFTLASTRIETFSIAALEAMSTGLPCVLTDIGGANEMIQPGINGFLVKPGSIDELVLGWEKCIEGLRSFENNKIRENVIAQFDLKYFVDRYEHFLLEKGLMDNSAKNRKPL